MRAYNIKKQMELEGKERGPFTLDEMKPKGQRRDIIQVPPRKKKIKKDD